ncbi:hypothetical protein [Microbulbifer variabilis]|uniref:hypothetical protein n=1 Tax=Microbulbifer variabilis TaxID=266805 RepID=UPI0003645511|nr:hypothetical protein [Microbulbifer variabilis]
MNKIFTLICLLVVGSNAASEPTWYRGEINRIWTYGQGDFIVTFVGNTGLSDCRHNYAYFTSADLHPEMLKSSLSVALSAYHTGETVGIVIDKDLNDDACHAAGIDLRK